MSNSNKKLTEEATKIAERFGFVVADCQVHTRAICDAFPDHLSVLMIHTVPPIYVSFTVSDAVGERDFSDIAAEVVFVLGKLKSEQGKEADEK